MGTIDSRVIDAIVDPPDLVRLVRPPAAESRTAFSLSLTTRILPWLLLASATARRYIQQYTRRHTVRPNRLSFRRLCAGLPNGHCSARHSTTTASQCLLQRDGQLRSQLPATLALFSSSMTSILKRKREEPVAASHASASSHWGPPQTSKPARTSPRLHRKVQIPPCTTARPSESAATFKNLDYRAIAK